MASNLSHSELIMRSVNFEKLWNFAINSPDKSKRIEFPTSANCSNCPYFIMKNCTFSNTSHCDCKLPKPKPHQFPFKNMEDLAFCLNCNHFILKSGDHWVHYHRPYTCKLPYSSEICVAPPSLLIKDSVDSTNTNLSNPPTNTTHN